MCRMKKSSFFATLLAIAILTPTCKTARGFYLGHRNLHIVNWLENGEKLMARCWSKDGSLGTRIVKNKEEFKWKFYEKIFFGHTKLECDLEFNDQGQPRRGRFVVYDSKQMVRRRSCYQNCMWGVGVYGLYAFDEKDKKWDYEIPWPSTNRFESSAQ
ncbi:SELF-INCOMPATIBILITY PROTEIN S1 FAMILY putative-RELATED [Salix viminalis]|uniref:S-protein homolog n=1 Tax=Salix viminalis TaxID=40686 RepID=A0A9Q0V6V6_SALVM|nr:SELF-INCOMPATIBILITY PROTEIN S1 FAMILY putative-RELATED [Salix viminalis]